MSDNESLPFVMLRPKTNKILINNNNINTLTNPTIRSHEYKRNKSSRINSWHAPKWFFGSTSNYNHRNSGNLI